uniref:Uncharacterized protein n=1 Tax=Parastrongyloides trichosuri TaxID=131310 RepID=A0A0N4ZDJ7_PARTI
MNYPFILLFLIILNINFSDGLKASCTSNRLEQRGRCRVSLRENENIRDTVLWPHLNDKDRRAIEAIMSRGSGNHAKEISDYLTNRADPDNIVGPPFISSLISTFLLF